MRLVFLGTGGYHPNERRHTAGVLFPELGLLLDAGTGTFRAAERLQTPDLTIALTHAHLDHVCGLTYLLVPLQTGRIRRLRVLAEAAVLETLRTHLFAAGLFPVLPPAEFIALDSGDAIPLQPGIELQHCPLPGHPGGSRAFRVNWRDSRDVPRSIAYVTDTTVDGTYTDFIRGADVLIHECYFPDDDGGWADRTGHSRASAVARLAREAHVGRLLLTHLDPQRPDDDPIGLPAARAVFPPTELAEDLLEVVVD